MATLNTIPTQTGTEVIRVLLTVLVAGDDLMGARVALTGDPVFDGIDSLNLSGINPWDGADSTPRIRLRRTGGTGFSSWYNLPGNDTVRLLIAASTDSDVVRGATHGSVGGGFWNWDLPTQMSSSNNLSVGETINLVMFLPSTSTDHEVDAGAANWSFTTSEPSVEHSQPQQMHEVDAGAASWSFTTSEPSVEHSQPQQMSNALGIFSDPDWVAQKMLVGTLSINCSLQHRWMADFSVLIEPGQPRLAHGTPVELIKGQRGAIGNTTLFAGTVDTIGVDIMPGADELIQTVTCVDYTQLLDRFLVTAAYENRTLGYIINDILTNPASSGLGLEGLTYVEDYGAGPLITKAIFNYQSARQAFDELIELTGWNYYLDFAKEFHFLPRVGRSVNHTLPDTYRALTLSGTRDQLRNRQYVRGGFAVSDPITETFIPDGEQQTFVVGLKVDSEPTIVVVQSGGTETPQTVAIRGIGTTAQWYWGYRENVITQDSGPDRLRPSQRLKITYRGLFPVIVRVDSGLEIEARKALEGGTGIYEWIENASRIEGVNEATDFATALIRRFGSPEQALTFTAGPTELVDAIPGNILEVDHDILPGSADFLIEGITVRDLGGEQLEKSFRCLSGEAYGGWRRWFEKLFSAGQDLVVQGDAVLLRLEKLDDAITIDDAMMVTPFSGDFRIGSAQVGFSEVV